LRKYLDYTSNRASTLIIVYGKLYGNIDDVVFPIKRSGKILIRDGDEFVRKIKLVPASRALEKLKGTEYAWVAQEVERIVQGTHMPRNKNDLNS
jgi:hypothetical protein